MANTKLLKEKIDECGYKLKFVAKQLEITYQGLLNKLQNKTEFTASEIQTLVDLLNLSETDRNAIFFAFDVECSSTERGEPA